MKKVLAILLCVAMVAVLALAGCGGDGGSSESLHLTLALSPEGFAGEDGLYGVNQNLDGVRGQEPLVEYLKELADKYEIPLAE